MTTSIMTPANLRYKQGDIVQLGTSFHNILILVDEAKYDVNSEGLPERLQNISGTVIWNSSSKSYLKVGLYSNYWVPEFIKPFYGKVVMNHD